MNSAAATVDDTARADRDIPNLRTKKKKSNLTRMIIVGAMLVGLIVVASGIAVTLKRIEANKKEDILAKSKEPKKETAPQPKNFDAAKQRILGAARTKEAAEANGLGDAASSPVAPSGAIPVVPAGAIAQQAGAGGAAARGSAGRGGASAAGSGQANSTPVMTAAQRRLSGDVLVDLPAGTLRPVSVANHNEAVGGFADTGAGVRPAASNSFDEKLKPSRLIGGVAAQRPDLTLLLRRGTLIACGQKTLIKTTHPGAVMCVVSKDVYSADGKVLLIERGSAAFGEQREGLSRGQDSIPVLWSRIDTPRGVAIDINSLGTDSLGASGLPAFIDNHNLERFGGAVMLSLISDFGDALANKAGDGQGTVRLSSTSTVGQDLATKTLESTINIPPTGGSHQGSAINILVLRDMDFRSVYELASF